MNSSFTHKKWAEENFRPVNKFYRSQKHKGSASGDEQVFVSYQSTQNENEPELVAAVRLVPYSGYFWLRSLYVKESLRGHGLGLTLLSCVHEHIQQPIYCFPYLHLDGFYGQAGYQLIETDIMPQPIQQLYERHNRKGDILAMMRP